MGLVLVEDFYGVEFHKTLIKMICGDCSPRVVTLGGYKCNQKVVRKALARLVDEPDARILIVVDSEGEDPDRVREAMIEHFIHHSRRHKRSGRIIRNIEVAVVVPRHERWLCEGLDLKRCGSDPEASISRALKRNYRKSDLAELVNRVSVERLRKLKDFKSYIEQVRWLCRCRQRARGRKKR